jgi:putative membrane protein
MTLTGRRVLQEYGFTVAESPDGLRLRHGLLDTRSQTIPAGRVQAVRVLEPLLWRPFGWVRVEVDVAGYGAGHGQEQTATNALLPVAPRALAEALVGRVLGGGLPVASAPVPGRVRWRAPLSRRRLRAGLDDRHLVTTHGVLTTTTDVVPLAKIQSLRLTSGPWQQRLRLATLHADTAGRRLPGGRAPHRDAAEAGQLVVELALRARHARST